MILGQKRGHAVIVPSSSLNIEIAGRLGPRDVIQVNCRVHERNCLCDRTSEAHDLVLGRAIANENDHHCLELVDAGAVVLRRELGLAVDQKRQIHVLVVAGLCCGLRLTYLPARTFTVASALDERSSFCSVMPGIM